MNEAAKDLMAGLADALENMPNNPQGIAGWILSNFDIRKIGDAAPVERFHGDAPQVPKTQSHPGSPHMAPTHDRYLGPKHEAARAIQATNAKLANLAQAIQGSQNGMYGGDEESSEIVVPEEIDPNAPSRADIEAAAELLGGSMTRSGSSQNRGGGKPAKLKDLLASQTESLVNPNAESLSPEEIAQLDVIKNRGFSESNALMKERMKRVDAQKKFDMGSGSFRRSE